MFQHVYKIPYAMIFFRLLGLAFSEIDSLFWMEDDQKLLMECINRSSDSLCTNINSIQVKFFSIVYFFWGYVLLDTLRRQNLD